MLNQMLVACPGWVGHVEVVCRLIKNRLCRVLARDVKMDTPSFVRHVFNDLLCTEHVTSEEDTLLA